jgi:hypothetical protein
LVYFGNSLAERRKVSLNVVVAITERVDDEGRELQQGLPISGGQPGLTHQEQAGHALHLVKKKKKIYNVVGETGVRI